MILNKIKIKITKIKKKSEKKLLQIHQKVLYDDILRKLIF